MRRDSAVDPDRGGKAGRSCRARVRGDEFLGGTRDHVGRAGRSGACARSEGGDFSRTDVGRRAGDLWSRTIRAVRRGCPKGDAPVRRRTGAGHGRGCSDDRASRRTRPTRQRREPSRHRAGAPRWGTAGGPARGGRRVPRCAGRRRTDGLRPLLRVLRRNGVAGRGARAGSDRSKLSERPGLADRGGAVRGRAGRDAAGARRVAPEWKPT